MLLDIVEGLLHCSLTAVPTAKAHGNITFAAADSMRLFYMQNLVTYQGQAANLRIDRWVVTADATVAWGGMKASLVPLTCRADRR